MSRRTIRTALQKSRAGMIPNRAGGFGFAVDPWVLLDRVLIQGTFDNTYYAAGAALTLDAVRRLTPLIQEDGVRVVERVVEVSNAGRAPSNDPALMVLALALAVGDQAVKAHAVEATPCVARTGTHLLTLVDYATQLRGWGRALRRAVQRWFLAAPTATLAYHAIKYQRRGFWSLRRALHVSHARTDDPQRNAVLYWIARGWPGIGPEPHPDPVLRTIWAFERLRRLDPSQASLAAQIIADERLPREAVPTRFLQHAEVWAALLPHMPLGAMLRNLATLTRLGVLAPLNDATRLVAERLTDVERLRRARIHPFHVLVASRTYAAGGSAKTKQTWQPIPAIQQALDEAFAATFSLVDPANVRMLLAVDVSGSMAYPLLASLGGITPREIGGVMAMVTARTEPRWHALWFHTACGHLPITPTMSLEQIQRTIANMPAGGTDISQPLLWAIDNRVPADAIVIITDNETWANREPVHVVLERYRDAVGVNAALIIAATTAARYSVADPNDPRSLNIAGFDTHAPLIIRDFAAGGFPQQQAETTEEEAVWSA